VGVNHNTRHRNTCVHTRAHLILTDAGYAPCTRQGRAFARDSHSPPPLGTNPKGGDGVVGTVPQTGVPMVTHGRNVRSKSR
jgi:hypothetical protein